MSATVTAVDGLSAVAAAVETIAPATAPAAHPAVAYTTKLFVKIFDKYPDTATLQDVIEATRAYVDGGKPTAEGEHKIWRATRRLHDATSGWDGATTVAALRLAIPTLIESLNLESNGRAVAATANGSGKPASGKPASAKPANGHPTDAAIVRMLRGAPAGMTVADFRAAIAVGNYGSPIAQTAIGSGLTLPGVTIAPYIAPDPVAVAVAAPAVHAAIAAFLAAQTAAVATGDTTAVAAALEALQAATAPVAPPARPIVRCPIAVAQQPGGEWQRAQRRAAARRAFRAAVAANVAAWHAAIAVAPQPASAPATAPAAAPAAAPAIRDRQQRRAQRAA